ncbi:MAG: DMT family transporter [bacterium]|nr:DMT family transporter [bacterium]
MSPLAYRLMAIAGVVCISFAPILVRAAEDAGDLTIAFFRSLYALPFLALLYWKTRSRDERPRRSRLIAVASGVFLGLDLTFWHASIGEIGAGLATVVVNMQVVFVALIAWVLFHERPGRRAIALLPVILLGVFLISGAGTADAYGDSPALGTAQSLLSAMFYALFVLLLRESGRGHVSPATGPLLDSTIGTAITTLVIGLVFTSDFSLAFSWPVHGWLILLALVAQVVGWLLIARALPNLPALETAVLLLGQPMLAILWARLLFDEAMSTSQWFGVGLVLAGLVIFSLRKSEAPKEP